MRFAFDKVNELEKSQWDWKNAINSLFKWHFHSRHHHGILNSLMFWWVLLESREDCFGRYYLLGTSTLQGLSPTSNCKRPCHQNSEHVCISFLSLALQFVNEWGGRTRKCQWIQVSLQNGTTIFDAAVVWSAQPEQDLLLCVAPSSG